jgi:thioesterase domain-containing protein/acyl carrier protein
MSQVQIHQRSVNAGITDKLKRMWCEILQVEDLREHDDFFALGGDSFAAAQLFVEIEREFDKRLPISTLLDGATIRHLTALLETEEDAVVDESCLVHLQPQGNQPAFFLVHGVGGEVLCYNELARSMAPQQPLYGIQVPASRRQGTETPTIEKMAGQYLEEVQAVRPRGPYYLGGYSFGGSVALEMAQQLMAQGEQVAFLAIVDHTPPPKRYGKPAWWRPAYLAEFVWNLPHWVRDDLFPPGSEGVWDRVRANAGTARRRIHRWFVRSAPDSAKADVETLFDLTRVPDQFRDLLEDHYAAMRAYTPRPYPGQVTLFRARTRPLLNLHGADLGWRELALGGLQVELIPGNHLSLLKEPYVHVLAERLKAALQKARTAAKA